MVRIGILTYFASINYGAFLQSYALLKCLESRYEGIAEVEIINYNSKIAQDVYLDRIIYQNAMSREKLMKQYCLFLESRKVLKLSEEELVSDNIDHVKEFLMDKYDIIIAGSDEIWKTNSFRGFPNAYWLNFNLGKTVYMAYAVSGRDNCQKMPKKMQAYIREALEGFAYIGTRDEITRQELLKIKEIKIERNCDPVFLNPKLFEVSEKRKSELYKKYELTNEKPIISIMIKNKEVGAKLYRMLKNDNQMLYLYEINEQVKMHNLVEVSPFEWSDLIGISQLVITDFFHGMAFSVLHKTPFVAVENEDKGSGKIESFLVENGMSGKFLYQADYCSNKELTIELYTRGRKELKYYDLSGVEKVLDWERQKAISFFEKLEEFVESFKGNLRKGFYEHNRTVK